MTLGANGGVSIRRSVAACVEGCHARNLPGRIRHAKRHAQPSCTGSGVRLRDLRRSRGARTPGSRSPRFMTNRRAS